MASLQPDKNHPRFHWKPNLSLESFKITDQDLAVATSHPPLVLTVENSVPSIIRVEHACSALSVDILEHLNLAVPEDVLRNLNDETHRHLPADDALLAANSFQLSRLQLEHVDTYTVQKATVACSSHNLVSEREAEAGDPLSARFTQGRAGGALELIWDLYDDDVKVDRVERWKQVTRILASLSKPVHLGNIKYLSDYVDLLSTEEDECRHVLRIGGLILEVERWNPAAASSYRTKSANTAIDARLAEDFSPKDSEGVGEEDDDLTEVGALDSSFKVASPKGGEPLVVLAPRPHRLARMTRILGFPVKPVFFKDLEAATTDRAELRSVTLRYLGELDRPVKLTHSLIQLPMPGRCDRANTVTLIDADGPFGGFKLSLQSDSQSPSGYLAAFHWLGDSDELKKLPWKKLLRYAGY